MKILIHHVEIDFPTSEAKGFVQKVDQFLHKTRVAKGGSK